MAGFIGAGYVKINRYDSDDNLTGFVDIGNISKLSIQADSETKERLSFRHDNYQQALDSVVIPKPHTVSMTGDEMSSMVMAIALLGEEAALAVTGASVDAGSPEDLVAVHDKYVALAHKHITSVVVKDATDTTTYVSGTDYMVDASLGQIKVLSTGDIADSATVHVSYTYATQAGTRVYGGTQSRIKVRLEMFGQNLASGKNVHVVIKELVISPSGAADFIGSDYISFELAGKITVPEGDTQPYYIDEYSTS